MDFLELQAGVLSVLSEQAVSFSSEFSAVHQYRHAYSVLKRGDHYLLVMIDQGLKRHLRPWWKFSSF
jgi:hypothetical protein